MFVTVFNGRGYIVYATIYGKPEMSKKKSERKKYMNFGEPYTFLKP